MYFNKHKEGILTHLPLRYGPPWALCRMWVLVPCSVTSVLSYFFFPEYIHSLLSQSNSVLVVVAKDLKA